MKQPLFRGVPLFDAHVSKPPWGLALETAKICVQCRKFHMQVVQIYLEPFRPNSLLKYVSQTEIVKNSLKPPILGTHGHSRSSMLTPLKSS